MDNITCDSQNISDFLTENGILPSEWNDLLIDNPTEPTVTWTTSKMLLDIEATIMWIHPTPINKIHSSPIIVPDKSIDISYFW